MLPDVESEEKPVDEYLIGVWSMEVESPPRELIETLIEAVIDDPAFAEIDKKPSTKKEKEKIVEYLVKGLSERELDAQKTHEYLVKSTLKLISPESLDVPSQTKLTILEDDPFEMTLVSKLIQFANRLCMLSGTDLADPKVIEKVDGVLAQLELFANGKDKDCSKLATDAINELLSHFKKAKREEKSSRFKLFGEKQLQTKLKLGNGSKLELHNKINPDTGEEQSLGAGGAGYGRFGVLDVPGVGKTTVFVKKAKAKFAPETARSDSQREALESFKQQETAKFHREVDIMKMLSDSPNVVQVYDGISCRDKKGKDKSYFVMEMLPGGDLAGLVKKEGEGKKLGIEAKKRIVYQALSGLAHAHSKGVLHRDLKPENIMLDGDFNAKLVDFGEACILDENGRFLETGSAAVGTKGFRAPNLEYGGDVSQKPPVFVFDRSTDIFAFKKTVEKILGEDVDDPLMEDFLKAMEVPGCTCGELLFHDAMFLIDEQAAKDQLEEYRT